jgi:hypothetical protein
MTVEQEGTTTNDLTIEINVRRKRTMSQYRLKKGGKLNFKNAHGKDDLVVTPKNGSPFVDNCGATLDKITVGPGCTVTVGISASYKEEEFLYKAQIGENTPDDPIVILE